MFEADFGVPWIARAARATAPTTLLIDAVRAERTKVALLLLDAAADVLGRSLREHQADVRAVLHRGLARAWEEARSRGTEPTSRPHVQGQLQALVGVAAAATALSDDPAIDRRARQ